MSPRKAAESFAETEHASRRQRAFTPTLRLFEPSAAPAPHPSRTEALRQSVKPLSLSDLQDALHVGETAEIAKIIAQYRKDLPLASLRVNNPLRSPDRRFQLALRWWRDQPAHWPQELLVDADPAPRLLVAVSIDQTRPAPQCLGVDPRLLESYHLLLADNACWLRRSVDMLILADVPAEDIAAEFDIPQYAVDHYERTFFDVRSRLHLPCAITHAVIGLPVNDESPEAAIDRERYRMAYFGGPVVARELVRSIGIAKCQQPKTDVCAVLRDSLRQDLLLKSALLLRALPINDNQKAVQMLKLFNMHRRSELREHRRKKDHAEVNHVRQAMHEFLASLKTSPLAEFAERCAKSGATAPS